MIPWLTDSSYFPSAGADQALGMGFSKTHSIFVYFVIILKKKFIEYIRIISEEFTNKFVSWLSGSKGT